MYFFLPRFFVFLSPCLQAFYQAGVNVVLLGCLRVFFPASFFVFLSPCLQAFYQAGVNVVLLGCLRVFFLASFFCVFSPCLQAFYLAGVNVVLLGCLRVFFLPRFLCFFLRSCLSSSGTPLVHDFSDESYKKNTLVLGLTLTQVPTLKQL